MVIQEIRYNEIVLKQFVTVSRNKTMAHAYLFSGPQYVGKTRTAIAIAQLINCENNENGDLDKACGTCSSCVKIEKHSHPDVEVTQVEFGQKISIESIRSLLEKSRMRAFEARKKVFILRSVENLTTEAANAFLKTLEEPSNDTLLILTTSSPENMLATIKSRCQLIHFYPFSRNELAEKLKSMDLKDGNAAHFLAFTAEGCLGKALELNDGESFSKKNDIINRFILSDDASYLKEVEKDKKNSQDVLNVLQGWIRDAILYKSGMEEKLLIHIDRIKDLKQFVKSYTLPELVMILQEAVKMKEMLLNNFNLKINFAILKTMFKS